MQNLIIHTDNVTTPSTALSNVKSNWPPPEPFAYMDDNGREISITDLMIVRACEALENTYSLGSHCQQSQRKA